MRHVLSLFCLAAVISGCNREATSPAPAGEAPPALSVEFLRDRVLTPSKDRGGLSAILYEPSKGVWLALSDAKDQPRVYELEVAFDETQGISVETRGRIDLVGFPVEAIDPEGLAQSPWGTLFVSTEPNLRDRSGDQPRLLEFDRDGAWRESLAVPSKFLPSQNAGVRHNLAFEALTVAPDGSRMFVGSESALVQDGPAADLDAVGFSRIIEYSIQERNVTPGPEYVYPVGPIGAAPELSDVEAMGGLVELCALSSTRLLALERVFIRERKHDGRNVTRVRLYDVDLESATNVQSIEQLSESDAWRPVTKELVLDFDAIIPSLSPEYPLLDNYEAMGFGPTLPDGSRSLLVVSDDNFREQQRTVFLLFRVKGG